MLVTLEGYNEYDPELFGWSLRKKLKKAKRKLKKKAKKIKKRTKRITPKKFRRAIKKTYKIAKPFAKPLVKKAFPYAVSAVATAYGVPIPPQAVAKGMSVGVSLVKGKGSLKKRITNTALKQVAKKTGINPKNIKAVRKAYKTSKKFRTWYKKTRKTLENKAISKVTQKYLKTKVVPKQRVKQYAEKKKWTNTQIKAYNRSQAQGQSVEKSVVKAESKKWTPAQIQAFNTSQKSGDTLATSVKKANTASTTATLKESYGDLYYKKGELEGDYKSELKLLATKIYSQNPYSSISLVSYQYVESIIEAYIYSTLKLSEKNNKSMYYNGTTEAERQKFFGNIYIKISYLYFMGLTTEAEAKEKGYDYTLRDQVWVVIALVKKCAEQDTTGTFIKFWKPYQYQSELPSEPTASKIPILPIAIAGAAVIFFMMKK